ncbi:MULTISPECIES: ABC transporter substrate-binding protein [unclassified Leifsonia]|uniref:ABC transporter substrate-binding protein n=1 Tax=unclassified Leifsonia TaxID=2663824 RepID=UPI0006F21C90|nr:MULTISPECIES: extracellular solute-binding protein [unclassified Leifsonia]KQX05284.1 sugar-binding protein [Leifsonia sp. Root1293]KRA08917.1 sugar-binding protein [Leifsonia sp. Root60]
MKLSRRTTAVAAVAGVAAIALLATGCSSSGDTGSGSSDEKVELTVTTFGTMGLDDLYKQYEEENPNVTIKATNIDTGGNALTDWKTKQAAGAGLPDVQAVEEGWLGQVQAVSDSFTDLTEYGANDIKDRWVDWKLKQGTDKDGRIIGYGTDIGPEGLCYNGKLFEAAGLPSDREAVAELFGGDDATWDDFFKVGEQYKAATGKPFYDQSGFVWNAMVNQLPEGYYTSDGKLDVENNADLKAQWEKLAGGAAAGLSSGQAQWDWGKGKAFTDGSFATFMCPGWMLGVVKGQVESAGGDATSGWDFADVFPGGPANWGGTFLTVPTTSKHPKEAAALAAYLTDAKSAVSAFQAAGTFPSVIEAQTDAGVTGESDLTKFFNNAPIGEILGSRAEGVVAQYKGPNDSVIQEQVFGPATQSLDKGASGDDAWNEAITTLQSLDLK